MGAHQNIGLTFFPKQSSLLGKVVKVYFRYDLREASHIDGTIVRDDLEPPYVTIFKLSDDRHVLATECVYRMT